MVSHPVGLKRPNPWGLYDMHGGIDEYCQDADHPTYAGAPDDQRTWLGGDDTLRIKRGAKLLSDVKIGRSRVVVGSGKTAPSTSRPSATSMARRWRCSSSRRRIISFPFS